jgi:glutamate carboxypeptidase
MITISSLLDKVDYAINKENVINEFEERCGQVDPGDLRLSKLSALLFDYLGRNLQFIILGSGKKIGIMIEKVSKSQLEQFFEENLPSYLDLLAQMVAVNSFTTNAEGVLDLGRLTAGIFTPLGFTAQLVPSTNKNYGSHLVLKNTADNAAAPTISMVSHLDTVFPPEEEAQNDFSWRVDGDRIYGPGTVDIKGGTVLIYMIMAALQEFAPTAYKQTNWTIFLNSAEEELTPDFSKLCHDTLPDDTLACLVFEGGSWSENCFNLVRARKGRATYEIEVQGRGAHAGSSHWKGANAVVQLARIINRVASLTNYKDQITFNVGMAEGGTVMNRVPHEARAVGEMRAFDIDIFNEGVANLLALQEEVTVRSAEDDYPCTIKITVINESAPWNRNEGTDYLYEHWHKTAASLGWETIPEERGGLSDGNFLWSRYPTIDGLGPSGENAHCSERSDDGSKDQEFVLATSFVPKAILNTLAMLALLDEQDQIKN